VAKDDDTGVDPKTRDGAPLDDDPNGGGLKAIPGGKRSTGRKRGGEGISDRARIDEEKRQQAAAAGEADEDAGELFPLGTLEGDPKVTLKSLIKPGHSVEYTSSMMSAEVPLTEGLLDPNEQHRALVMLEFAGVTPVPIRKTDATGTKKIVGWKIRQQFRVVHVQTVKDKQEPAAANG
jgi:hypothetical protein